MPTLVRFAPSPTGNIHIGNARTALINWLFAQQNHGTFILRFDDTDRERSTVEFAREIERDLDWLGIRPDIVARQSERSALYRQTTDELVERGLLYPCFETPDELDRKRKRQAARGLPPVYDRSALKLAKTEKAALEREGRKPHYRFLLPNFESDPLAASRTEINWNDLVAGPQTVDLASVSDPVLLRGDGSWLYTLPSVVDDIEMDVTHIIRGSDHITNTGVQIAIFEALGNRPPTFAHHNLLMTASGEGLSKRFGSLSIRNLAEEGYEPMAVASLAVLIGGAGAVEPIRSMNALADRFEMSAVGKSAARFDEGELDGLNRKLVHQLEWEQVADRFPGDAFGGNGKAFWLAVRDNLDRTADANIWWERIDQAEPLVDGEDRDYLTEARACLPDGPFDDATWSNWTNLVKERTGRRGRALFMPLRKALTGMERGPEMATLLPVIGREKTLARLS